MFCSKCGAKAIEGALFCPKCGAKLMVGDVGSTTAERSVQTVMQEPMEPMASEASKDVEEVKPETLKPDKPIVSEVQKSAEPDSQAAAETKDTFEFVSAGDVYNLLREIAPNCHKISKIDFQQKAGITTLKGKKNRYFIGFSRGDYTLSVCPKFLLSIHRIIFLFVIVVTLSLLADGVDLEEIYPLLGWCLLIGGVGGIVSEIICRGEKKEVVPFIKGALAKIVCVKEPVAPILEPLVSHPCLWFLGFPLPIASVIQPILYSVAALAGIVVLVVGSGALYNNIGVPSYNESAYDEYSDRLETDQYMPSSDIENISLSKIYTNEEEGIFFMYPEDWTVREVDGAVFCISAPANSIGFSKSILAAKFEEIDSYSAEEIFSSSISDLEEWYSYSVGDVQIMEVSDITLNGYSARKVIYLWGDSRGDYTNVDYYYTMNDSIYEVCCTTLADSFTEDEPVFDAMINSYTITTYSGDIGNFDAVQEAYAEVDASEIVNKYEGSWVGQDYDRIYMEISYDGSIDDVNFDDVSCFSITINERGGASEWLQWELWGTYIEEEGNIHYYGSRIYNYVSYETGEIEEEVLSMVEEGLLWIGDDGVLYWDDFVGSTEECVAFEKTIY